MVELYSTNKRKAIGELLNLVENMMRTVTIQAPSYKELMNIFLMRKIYMPSNVKLTAKQEFETNQRFSIGFRKFKDHPEV